MKRYISLTSINQRQDILYETLLSIKNQTIKIDQCFIYLSEEPYISDIGFRDRMIDNVNLKKIIQENDLFVVKWVKNTGPYRKLLPLLKEKWDENCIIITLDDDVVYNKHIIEKMINKYEEHKCCISYRGFSLDFDKIENIDYEKRCALIQTYLFNFHTGNGGVLYHPSFFKKTHDLIFDSTVYTELCKTSDDIWFNLIRIVNHIPCYVGCIDEYFDKINLGKYPLFGINSSLNTINIQHTIKKLYELGYFKYNEIEIKKNNTFLINLKRRKDRLDIFLNKIDIDYSLVYGFDGYNYQHEQNNHLYTQFQSLNSGERGCFISHLQIYRKMVENDLDYCLILEDDAIFENGFNYQLKKVLDQIHSEITILYIGGRFKLEFKMDDYLSIRLSNNITKYNLSNKHHLTSLQKHRTTHSYIISNKTAKIIIDEFDKTINNGKYNGPPIDRFLIDTLLSKNIDIYDSYPHICYSPFISDSDIR